jgi:hypothetical protein
MIIMTHLTTVALLLERAIQKVVLKEVAALVLAKGLKVRKEVEKTQQSQNLPLAEIEKPK